MKSTVSNTKNYRIFEWLTVYQLRMCTSKYLPGYISDRSRMPSTCFQLNEWVLRGQAPLTSVSLEF